MRGNIFQLCVDKRVEKMRNSLLFNEKPETPIISEDSNFWTKYMTEL